MKEPLSEQARKAQSFTLALSGIAVALGLQLVQITKLPTPAGEVVIVGGSAALVVTGLSLFFLLRFVLYCLRDNALFKWTKGRAALGVKKFFQPFDDATSDEEVQMVAKQYGFSHRSFYKVIREIERTSKFRKWIDFIFPIALWAVALCLLLLSARKIEIWPGI